MTFCYVLDLIGLCYRCVERKQLPDLTVTYEKKDREIMNLVEEELVSWLYEKRKPAA